ncbi:MAG: hypothetical protein ACRD0Q_11325 [Acidimicrobiales bacterium]
MRTRVRTASFAAGISLVASMVTAGPSLATPINDTTVHVNVERVSSRGSTIDLGSLLGDSSLGDSSLGEGRADQGLSLDLGVDGLLRGTADRPISPSGLPSIDLGGAALPVNRPDANQSLSIRVDLGGVARSTGNATESTLGGNGTGLLSGISIDLGGNGEGLLGLGSGTSNGGGLRGVLGLGSGTSNGGGLLGLGGSSNSSQGLLGGIL